MGFKLWFKRRPDIDEQNTGHEAFQRPMGIVTTGFNGLAGFITGSLAATYPGTIVPGESLVKRDPTVTGNPNVNLELRPLSEQDPLQAAISSYGNRSI